MTISFRGREISYMNKQDFFEVVESGTWEPETFDMLDRFIIPGKTFIDIGAWIGVLSIYASLLGAKCYAIEPDPIAYPELIANIVANNLRGSIEPCNIAISDVNGSAKLNSMNAIFGNSESSLVDRGRIQDSVTVQTESLDNFMIKRHISGSDICLIKIDVEGSEMLIIDGAYQMIAKMTYKPIIFISFHPGWMNLKTDVAEIIRTLFPIYDFYNVDMMPCSEKEFSTAFTTPHNHSFLLKPKI